MQELRLSDHALGEIHAERNRAPLGRRSGDVARSAGDVEQLYSLLNAHGVEQRFDRLNRKGAEGLVIIVGNALPTRQLKSMKFFQFENHNCYSPRLITSFYIASRPL